MPDVNPSAAAETLHERAGLRIARGPQGRRLLLRGPTPALSAAYGMALPTTPCRAAGSALWLGPDEWLLLDSPDAGPHPGSAVDVSDRQLALILEGNLAPDVLAAGCPLDLHPTAFPVGMCTRTVFGKAEIVLWRMDAQRWRIEVWRSFAAYVQGLMIEAARGL